MIRGFFLFLVLIFLVPNLGAQNKSAINQKDEQRRKQGVWKKKNVYGRMIYEGNFLDDKPLGEFKYYYGDGGLKAVSKFEKNGSISYTVFYHPNGKMMARGKFINEKKDSTWNFYRKSDELLVSKDNYLDGKIHGESISYYPNGVIAEIINYNEGVKHGEWVKYFQDGSIQIEGNYINDNIEGKYRIYYPGKILKASGEYKKSLKHGEWKYYSILEELEKHEIFEDGKIVKEKE
ncbi:MAG: hypothetical protein JEY97_07135 [Bacteroidales bacterium]|nr:hypothetical protein [Bacteroidales bacterium]